MKSNIEYFQNNNDFKEIKDKLQDYQSSEIKYLKSSQNSISPIFDQLNELQDNNLKKKLLFDFIKSTFNLNTYILKSTQAAYNKNKNIIDSKNNLQQNFNNKVKEINDKNSTLKRKVKIQTYQFKKMLNEIRLLKICAIVLAIASIPAFLSCSAEFCIFSKYGALLLWLSLIIPLSIYIVYELVFKFPNRDDLIFENKNFKKPKLQSADEDTKDSKKMLDFDPDEINIGNVDKYINDKGTCDADQSIHSS